MKSFLFLSAVMAAKAFAAEPSSKKIDIHGADASRMFAALQAAAVPASPADGASHAVTLEAKTLSCQVPTVVKPDATCTILSGTTTLKAPSAAAADLLGVIKANNGGKADPGGLGADVVAVDSVNCRHEPGAQDEYSCTYVINLRD